MSLSRAKDSCQDLLALAKSNNAAAILEVATTPLSSENKTSTHPVTFALESKNSIDLAAQDGKRRRQHAEESASSYEYPGAKSTSLWRPGLDVADYEDIVPLKKSTTTTFQKRKNCFSCLLAPWLIYDGDDSDEETDDDGSLEFNHQLDQKKQSLPPKSIGSGSTGSSRGVLKNTSIRVQAFLGVNVAKRLSFHPEFYKQRYSSEDDEQQQEPIMIPQPYFGVRFCSTKRVLWVEQPTTEDRDRIWWQPRDFNHFKGSISLLTKPDEEEAVCAIWLANRSLSSSPNKSDTDTSDSSTSRGSEDTSVSDTSSSDSEEEEFYHEKSNTSKIPKHEQEDQKIYKQWWHKYGDSRRGLEKHACSEQAKQTIEGYSTAVQKVLDEQLEQRFFKKNDPEKIARVYREYTAWSGDLALAAAASDADAVKCNFDDTKRKTREYFLLKQIYKNNRKIHKHLPGFMMPSGLKPRGYLDEHASNIIPYSTKKDEPLRNVAMTA